MKCQLACFRDNFKTSCAVKCTNLKTIKQEDGDSPREVYCPTGQLSNLQFSYWCPVVWLSVSGDVWFLAVRLGCFKSPINIDVIYLLNQTTITLLNKCHHNWFPWFYIRSKSNFETNRMMDKPTTQSYIAHWKGAPTNPPEKVEWRKMTLHFYVRNAKKC